MAVALASEVGVTSNITFLRSGRASMPMACGVLRPAVIMPAEADTWSADRLRVVLLHELAHVKRRDCLTHVLAQVGVRVPLVQPAGLDRGASACRTERERACDDLVLACGTRGSDYADQLLEMARVLRGDRFPALLGGASLAMAHRSQLEGRLMAILDPRVPRAALTRLRAAAAATVCCAAVVPLAALQPWTLDTPTAPVRRRVVQPRRCRRLRRRRRRARPSRRNACSPGRHAPAIDDAARRDRRRIAASGYRDPRRRTASLRAGARRPRRRSRQAPRRGVRRQRIEQERHDQEAKAAHVQGGSADGGRADRRAQGHRQGSPRDRDARARADARSVDLRAAGAGAEGRRRRTCASRRRSGSDSCATAARSSR